MIQSRITFTGYIGDQALHVELVSPDGGGQGYHVTIDHYHEGVMFKRQGRWVFYGNERSIITGADILILGDIIDEVNSKN